MVIASFIGNEHVPTQGCLVIEGCPYPSSMFDHGTYGNIPPGSSNFDGKVMIHH